MKKTSEQDSATQEQSTQNTESSTRLDAQQAMAFWHDKQYKDVPFYLFITIVLLELVVGCVALFYGIIHAEPHAAGGVPQFQFPWLGYGLAAVMVPAGLLLIVHLSGVEIFSTLRGKNTQDAAWQEEVPERLRKAYAIIQGAPTVVLLLGIMLLGVALLYFDGAMAALLRLGSHAEKYLPWIIGGILALCAVGYLGRLWFRYRTKHMEAEYAYRREVLERTGVIIVGQGSMQLPPAQTGITYNVADLALEAGEAGAHTVDVDALPVAKEDNPTLDNSVINESTAPSISSEVIIEEKEVTFETAQQEQAQHADKR